MQAYFLFIFVAVTTEQVFAHAPVSTLHKHFLAVDEKCHHRESQLVRHHLVIILFDTEVYFFLIKHLAVVGHTQVEGVQVRLAIPVRPPKAGIFNHKLRETGLVECHRGLTSGRDDIGLFHLDVAGGDNPFEGHTAFFISRVFQPGGNHHLGTRQLRQVVTHPGVFHNHIACNIKADMTGDAVETSRDVRHPVPPGTCQVTGAACNPVRAFTFAAFLLVGIGNQHGNSIPAIPGKDVGNVIACAHHVAAHILCRFGRTRKFHTVHIKIGVTVRIVEVDPHPFPFGIFRRCREFRTIPERTAVETFIHTVDVIGIIGIFLFPGLDIGGEHNSGHHPGNSTGRHGEAGCGNLRPGNPRQIILRAKLPARPAVDTVERCTRCHGAAHSQKGNGSQQNQLFSFHIVIYV